MCCVATLQAHQLTLQFYLWDAVKGLESQEPRALGHLARIYACLVARFALPLTMVKV